MVDDDGSDNDTDDVASSDDGPDACEDKGMRMIMTMPMMVVVTSMTDVTMGIHCYPKVRVPWMRVIPT